jgi:hypothetical protein
LGLDKTSTKMPTKLKLERPERVRLDATVCREIIQAEVTENGPISVWEMHSMVARVFPKNHVGYMLTAVAKKNSGLCIIEGIIDTVPKGLKPPARHELRQRQNQKKNSWRNGTKL